MALSIDKAFGIHQYTMQVRNHRAEVLAGNLANADTPGYKARDLDFKNALAQAGNLQFQKDSQLEMTKTSSRHFDVNDLPGKEPDKTLKYRMPYQADTGNGNTVEVHTERMKYVDNSIEYQATLQFLNGRITKLMSALRTTGA
ncbi:MAG: flagellar basal body rod protein FlgB [Succinivibrio sp.]|nr:flagellar basal body rod protein FlgB [Succinivibrio sp.]